MRYVKRWPTRGEDLVATQFVVDVEHNAEKSVNAGVST